MHNPIPSTDLDWSKDRSDYKGPDYGSPNEGDFHVTLPKVYTLDEIATSVAAGRQNDRGLGVIKAALVKLNGDYIEGGNNTTTPVYLGVKSPKGNPDTYDLYEDVTPELNRRIEQALGTVKTANLIDIASAYDESHQYSMSAEEFFELIHRPEFYKNSKDGGDWDYKKKMQIFANVSDFPNANLSHFFYYGGHGKPYDMGYNGRCPGLLEFDDSGNINFGVTMKKLMPLFNDRYFEERVVKWAAERYAKEHNGAPDDPKDQAAIGWGFENY